MATRQRISLTLKDKSLLYGFAWTTDLEKINGNIIIVTGMEETAIRYDDFAKFLVSNGYNVYCIDHFGQGENVKEDLSNLGVWPASGFRKMVVAVDDLVAKLRVSCVPIYIFAHSMGSFMMQDYVQRYAKHVSKVVLCGTGSKNPLAKVAYTLSRMTTNKKNRNKKAPIMAKLMFGSFNKKIKPARTEFDWLSVNEANVDKYIADPKCGFGPNKGFCLEFFKGMSRLWQHKFLKKVNKHIKIMLIAGEGDPVTNYGKSPAIMQKMYHHYGVEDVRTKVYPNCRHEILNEADEVRLQAYNDVLAFFNDDNDAETTNKNAY